MTGFNKRIYDMLTRVLVFARTYPQFFHEGSRGAQLSGEIDTAVRKLSAEAIAKASGKRAVKESSRDRAEAREALRDQLVAISRTAKGLKLSQFWIRPRQWTSVPIR